MGEGNATEHDAGSGSAGAPERQGAVAGTVEGHGAGAATGAIADAAEGHGAEAAAGAAVGPGANAAADAVEGPGADAATGTIANARHVDRRDVSPGELFAIQPGLARLMPEIGDRFWKCYYAAQAENWPLAAWQMREMKKLFRLGNVTRPKYTEDVDRYMAEMLAPLTESIAQQDFAGFDRNYSAAVVAANGYHGKWNKGYLVWKLPGTPPPDLDLRPRPEPPPS